MPSAPFLLTKAAAFGGARQDHSYVATFVELYYSSKRKRYDENRKEASLG